MSTERQKRNEVIKKRKMDEITTTTTTTTNTTPPSFKKSKTERSLFRSPSTNRTKANPMEPMHPSSNTPIDQLFIYVKGKDETIPSIIVNVASSKQVFSFKVSKTKGKKKTKNHHFQTKTEAIKHINGKYINVDVNVRTTARRNIHEKVSFLVKKGELVLTKHHTLLPYCNLLYKNEDGVHPRYICLCEQSTKDSVHVIKVSQEVASSKTLLQDFKEKYVQTHEKETPTIISIPDDSSEEKSPVWEMQAVKKAKHNPVVPEEEDNKPHCSPQEVDGINVIHVSEEYKVVLRGFETRLTQFITNMEKYDDM
jgi:hypothetical protein